MRGKFGINDMGSVGDNGNVYCSVRAVIVRDDKGWDSKGMKWKHSVELPKPDVAGSVPVARSNFLQSLSPLDSILTSP